MIGGHEAKTPIEFKSEAMGDDMKFMNRSSMLMWLLFVLLIEVDLIAGGACSSALAHKPASDAKLFDPALFVKNQNQILFEALDTKKPTKDVFYTFLSVCESVSAFDRIRLGSTLTKDDIENLFKEFPERKPEPWFGREQEQISFISPPVAHLGIKVNRLASNRIRFQFGAFRTEYKREFVGPSPSSNPQIKRVHSIEYGAIFTELWEYEVDPAIFNGHFNDYEYMVEFSLTDTHEKKEQAINKFRQRVDLVIKVRNALSKRHLLSWKRMHVLKSPDQVRTHLLNELSESERLVQEFTHFVSLPFYLTEDQIKRSTKDLPLVFHFED